MLNSSKTNATHVQIFNNPQFGEIRTVGTSESPLFCLADLCRILGLSSKGVNQRLADEVISNYPIIDNLGRAQQALFVNEDGLYDVILDSRKPEAKIFRKWVTSEVLPAIRKNGGYIASRQDDTPELIMARALQVAQSTIERHAAQLQLAETVIKEQAPKVQYFDTVLQSNSTHTMTQVAKELGMSAHKLGNLLNQKGVMFYQSGQWLFYAKYQDKGYGKPRTHHYTKADGTTGTNTITVFTEAGRQFIHSLFNEERRAV